MKNILHPAARQEILSRIDKISPETKALWGKMNSAQVLRHMTMAFQIPMKEIGVTSSKTKPPKWLMRFFLLNMKPPKGKAKTFPEIDMVGNDIMPKDFEAERRNLKNYVDKFDKADSLLAENAYGGKFSRDDWGLLMYNHTDHHLRQFGA